MTYLPAPGEVWCRLATGELYRVLFLQTSPQSTWVYWESKGRQGSMLLLEWQLDFYLAPRPTETSGVTETTLVRTGDTGITHC